MELELKFPTEEYKEKVMAYKQDFLNNGDELHGTAGLLKAKSFEAWLKAIHDNNKEETVRDGLVPATTFLAVNENDDIVGMIDVRHRLSDYLAKVGGHIGYSINKVYRRQGAATKMLALALEECKKLNIQNVMITCDKENIGSAKTIINNGGVMENEVPDEGRITQRYFISL